MLNHKRNLSVIQHIIWFGIYFIYRQSFVTFGMFLVNLCAVILVPSFGRISIALLVDSLYTYD